MNEQDVQHRIDSILADLDKQRSTTDERELPPQQHPRIIDVYIIEREAEELPIVESTLNPTTQESQDTDVPEMPTSPRRAAHRTFPHWFLVVLVVLCVLIIGVGTRLSLFQLVTPSATITLVTASQQLTTTSTMQLLTNGRADSEKNQVSGRVLPAITMSQQKTIPTTGATHQAAQEAHGLLTFYNAAPSVQMVVAGTLLTGADGVQVTTDQAATIPAARMPIEGQVRVSAHTVITGPQGNITAGDIYGACCRLNVFVANAAFQGGKENEKK